MKVLFICLLLLFFTVYGPWGRPDMALFSFTKAILEGRPIQIFNHGRMRRDFTYIDDIVEGVLRVTLKPAEPSDQFRPEAPSPAVSSAPFRLYNIGNNTTVGLEDFVAILEKALGRKATRNYLPMQDGDVAATFADIEALRAAVGFAPKTHLQEGVEKFVAWYKDYHKL